MGKTFWWMEILSENLFSMASLKKGLPVVEIGPGLGTLTQELLEKNHCVFAVEIDQNLSGICKENFQIYYGEKIFFY